MVYCSPATYVHNNVGFRIKDKKVISTVLISDSGLGSRILNVLISVNMPGHLVGVSVLLVK